MPQLPDKNKSKLKPSSPAQKALEGLNGLFLLEKVFQDAAGRLFIRFLKWLIKKEEENSVKGSRRYGKLWRSIVEQQEFIGHPRVGTLLQDYFLERLLENDNAFHRRSEQVPLSQMTPSLISAYVKELEIFQKIMKTDWEGEFLKRTGFKSTDDLPSWEGVKESSGTGSKTPLSQARKRIKEKMLSAKGPALLSDIQQYFFQNGFGLFGRYRAFRWEVARNGEGRLAGIDPVDPIRLKNLIGYDEARQALLENIQGFVAGKGANNVLIYGERGTGKSSTVKALLNEYQEQGLRVVEILASHLNEYHDVLHHLKYRKEKFILFVDDLSFEENETSYKGLKALLEGTIETTPSNVILIATSNRRHLVREFFDDRAGAIQKEGEIHGADTIEEKLSLSDRFGLVVSFYSPNQDIYLKIVESWAKLEGLKVPPEELRLKSLQWARFNNGRSGRTARQFINDLKGKM